MVRPGLHRAPQLTPHMLVRGTGLKSNGSSLMGRVSEPRYCMEHFVRYKLKTTAGYHTKDARRRGMSVEYSPECSIAVLVIRHS